MRHEIRMPSHEQRVGTELAFSRSPLAQHSAHSTRNQMTREVVPRLTETHLYLASLLQEFVVVRAVDVVGDEPVAHAPQHAFNRGNQKGQKG